MAAELGVGAVHPAAGALHRQRRHGRDRPAQALGRPDRRSGCGRHGRIGPSGPRKLTADQPFPESTLLSRRSTDPMTWRMRVHQDPVAPGRQPLSRKARCPASRTWRRSSASACDGGDRIGRKSNEYGSLGADAGRSCFRLPLSDQAGAQNPRQWRLSSECFPPIMLTQTTQADWSTDLLTRDLRRTHVGAVLPGCQNREQRRR